MSIEDLRHIKINNTRKYRMKIKLLVAAAATVVASSAMAQSAFEGAYGQLGIGYQSSKPAIDGINFSSSSGFGGTVGAGYNFSIDKTFLLGIGVEYSPIASPSANFSFTNDDNENETGKFKNQNTYNIFVSPGIAINKDALAYAKIGYTGTSIKVENGGPTWNLSGYSLGLGYKQIISGGLSGFAEGNYLSYGNKTVTDDQGSYKVNANSMNLLVGVGYKF
jgi:opacity protein-like surface antigen